MRQIVRLRSRDCWKTQTYALPSIVHPCAGFNSATTGGRLIAAGRTRRLARTVFTTKDGPDCVLWLPVEAEMHTANVLPNDTERQ